MHNDEITYNLAFILILIDKRLHTKINDLLNDLGVNNQITLINTLFQIDDLNCLQGYIKYITNLDHFAKEEELAIMLSHQDLKPRIGHIYQKYSEQSNDKLEAGEKDPISAIKRRNAEKELAQSFPEVTTQPSKHHNPNKIKPRDPKGVNNAITISSNPPVQTRKQSRYSELFNKNNLIHLIDQSMLKAENQVSDIEQILDWLEMYTQQYQSSSQDSDSSLSGSISSLSIGEQNMTKLIPGIKVIIKEVKMIRNNIEKEIR